MNKPISSLPINYHNFKILLFLLGMIAVTNQVVYIREFIGILSGNEFIIGIIMSSWMMITAMGALFGIKSKFFSLKKKMTNVVCGISFQSFNKAIYCLLILCLLPIVLISLLYYLKKQFYPPGTSLDPLTCIIASFITLFPVCFLSGYLFTVFSTALSESGKKNLIGQSYAVESIGSLIGGLLFSLVLGRYFNSFRISCILACIVTISSGWIISNSKKAPIKASRRNKRQSISTIINLIPRIFKAGAFGILVATIIKLFVILDIKIRKGYLFPGWKFIIPGFFIPVLIFALNPDNILKKLSFPSQKILSNKSTRYGNLLIASNAEQINIYENNNLQFYSDNTISKEESVHFAMVQHKQPKQILLICGGLAGMIEEIEKYNVEQITYLESNPEIFEVLKDFTKDITKYPNVKIIKSDIRKFIAGTNKKYDVILINLPAPSSLGLNRFYTGEFFKLIKEHCRPETVICTSLPSSANYAENNALLSYSTLYKTLGLFFKNELIIKGEKDYFLVSDRQLSGNISKMIAERKILTEYVNQYYFNDDLSAMRSKEMTSQFNNSVPINSDFYPYLFIKQISHWLSYFGTPYKLIIYVPLLAFLLFFLLKTNRITAGLYTGGFTAASMEVTLLLAYQVYFGSIYLATALFIGIFMAGLAFGSSSNVIKYYPVLKQYYLLQFSIAIIAFSLPFLVLIIGNAINYTIITQIIFLLLILIIATGIGYEFLLASQLNLISYSKTSGTNYSTDLIGSAFGAFISTIILLPKFGLKWTCFLVAFLNIFSGVLAMSKGRRA